MGLEFELLDLQRGLGTILTQNSWQSHQVRTLSKPGSVPERVGRSSSRDHRAVSPSPFGFQS